MFVKNNNSVDVVERIVSMTYMYEIFFITNPDWRLTDEERRFYSWLLFWYCTGRANKPGWIKECAKEAGGTSSTYRYEYIKRIRQSEWIRKVGKDHIFAPDLVAAARDIIAGKAVEFVYRT